jgi:hypothetical protein
VYPVSLPSASATCRTVLGPRAQSTRRMASSASVGFFRMAGIIYDSVRIVNEALRRYGPATEKLFVCFGIKSCMRSQYDHHDTAAS